jgi:glycosyltransferase involved in cell wall biosynthesis
MVKLAIVIPCHNEARAIGPVLAEYHAAFPEAELWVVDNASTDGTAEEARRSGARVIGEPRKGKANAIRAALDVIEAEAVLMVDGDGSYPAEAALILWKSHLDSPADMWVGVRTHEGSGSAFRPMHQWGTALFCRAARLAFGYRPRDIFSGLRLFSRRFYKNIPVLSRGFELEMELTIQAIDKGLSIREVDTPFRSRHAGTTSKLRTVRDGLAILRFLGILCRDYKPMASFGMLSALLLALCLAAGSLPVMEYIQTGFIGRLPLAVLAAALGILSMLFFTVGLTLESALRHQREAFQIRIRQFRS